MKLFLIFIIVTFSFQVFSKTLTNHSANYSFELDSMKIEDLELYLDELRNEMTFSDFIALGCQARAHYISNYFSNKGYKTGKIIIDVDKARSQDKYELAFKDARWDWHISNLIVVDRKDEDEVLVIDLSISKKPIRVEEYVNILTRKELIPNGVSFDITFCPKDCFIKANKSQSLSKVKSFSAINNKLTEKYITVMKSYLGRSSNIKEQEEFFLNNI